MFLLLRFLNTCELWSLKANWHLHFPLPSIILVDLLGNRTPLKWIQKVMVFDLWLVGFNPFCVFQGSLLGIIIMIDGSKKHDCEGGFWTLKFACLWKAQWILHVMSKCIFFVLLTPCRFTKPLCQRDLCWLQTAIFWDNGHLNLITMSTIQGLIY